MRWWPWRGERPGWSGASRKGGRSVNQDSWAARRIGPQRWAVVLADGLGGHADGRIAADIAVRVAMRSLCGETSGPIEAAVRQAVGEAAEAVSAARIARSSDLASTICVLTADLGQAAWAHCGDSRIYRLNANGTAQRLTIDHSVAMAALPEEERARADVRAIAGRNRLVAVLGMDDPLVDCGEEPIGEAAGYALCSDGFWESAPEADLFKGLAPGARVSKLVAAAVARQGCEGDNVTLAVFWPNGGLR